MAAIEPITRDSSERGCITLCWRRGRIFKGDKYHRFIVRRERSPAQNRSWDPLPLPEAGRAAETQSPESRGTCKGLALSLSFASFVQPPSPAVVLLAPGFRWAARPEASRWSRGRVSSGAALVCGLLTEIRAAFGLWAPGRRRLRPS
jgi:hypothetical protein